MSVDKTLTDRFRRDLAFEKYEVFDAVPTHFDDKYPNLVAFLEKYHESLEQGDNPVTDIQKLLTARDIVSTKTEFLTFIASELLLGKPYFENFNDKRSALQYSNLLYRSKGTEFSIKQFFRIFYNVDIDVEYGRDEMFIIGEPSEETLEYEGNGLESGSNFPFTYPNATILVYLQLEDGSYVELREGTDYIIDFANKVVVIQSSIGPLNDQEYQKFLEAMAHFNLTRSDAYLNFLMFQGLLAFGTKLRIVSQRRVLTTIGADVTDKRITDGKFYQLYGLLISTPISVQIWKDAYKTFIHPAGMYLAGQVDITSIFDLDFSSQPPAVIQPPPPVLIIQDANISIKQQTRGLMTTAVTEIGPGPNGYRVVSRPNDMFHPRTIDNWHTQYGSMADADDINARTLDDTYADLSNNFNLMDEGVWHYDYLHPTDSDGAGNRTPIWGYNEDHIVQYDSDFPHGPEYTV